MDPWWHSFITILKKSKIRLKEDWPCLQWHRLNETAYPVSPPRRIALNGQCLPGRYAAKSGQVIGHKWKIPSILISYIRSNHSLNTWPQPQSLFPVSLRMNHYQTHMDHISSCYKNNRQHSIYPQKNDEACKAALECCDAFQYIPHVILENQVEGNRLVHMVQYRHLCNKIAPENVYQGVWTCRHNAFGHKSRFFFQYCPKSASEF